MVAESFDLKHAEMMPAWYLREIIAMVPASYSQIQAQTVVVSLLTLDIEMVAGLCVRTQVEMVVVPFATVEHSMVPQ